MSYVSQIMQLQIIVRAELYIIVKDYINRNIISSFQIILFIIIYLVAITIAIILPYIGNLLISVNYY